MAPPVKIKVIISFQGGGKKDLKITFQIDDPFGVCLKDIVEKLKEAGKIEKSAEIRSTTCNLNPESSLQEAGVLRDGIEYFITIKEKAKEPAFRIL